MSEILCFKYNSLDFKILKVEEDLWKILYMHTNADSEEFENENLYKIIPQNWLGTRER